MFLIGCFGLPFLWFANTWYFRAKIFDERTSKTLRYWLCLSLLGSVIAGSALFIWVLYFQITKNSWNQNWLVYTYAPPQNNSTNSTVPIGDIEEELPPVTDDKKYYYA